MPIICPDGEKARYRFKKKKLSGGRKARLAFCGNQVVEVSIFKNKKKIKEKRIKPKGWRSESTRHSLARKGIKTRGPSIYGTATKKISKQEKADYFKKQIEKFGKPKKPIVDSTLKKELMKEHASNKRFIRQLKQYSVYRLEHSPVLYQIIDTTSETYPDEEFSDIEKNGEYYYYKSSALKALKDLIRDDLK